MSVNLTILSGGLTKDPELTTTSNGLSKLQFTLAVDRPYTKNGEKETDFFTIIAWRTLADNCYKYLKKGSRCTVIGSIQTRSYEAKDGTKRYVTEILADRVEFLSSKTENENKPQTESQKKQEVMKDFTPIDDSQLPF